MNIQTSTAERAPRSLSYTPETKQLFIRSEELAEDVGITGLKLWSGISRVQPLTLIRHCIMYTLRVEFHWNYLEIGKVFKRSHDSVIYACRRMSELVEINDPQAMRYLQQLTKYDGTYTQAKETECIPCTCRATQRPQVS